MSSSNKLIYKNTLYIYGRMLFVIIVSLFSSRFVLHALGASDYGLYNVVGGLIALFNILGTAMSTTTRRFVNIEMGKPDGNINRVFNVCLFLHISFAVLIFLIAETIGVWYINNILRVAEGKLGDAMFVFQFSTIVACLGIINIPYASLIEANEQFGKSALIDIVVNIIKFVLVIVLLYYHGNAIRFYALSMCLASLLSFVMYHMVCYRNWSEVIRLRVYKKSSLYKDIFFFNNYIALGAASSIAQTQGSNMIVNLFFGTVVNAAFAVAYQVQSAVYMFVNKLTLASYPQVTINYSGSNMMRVNELVENNSRICILIMILLFFPLISEMDYVLGLWLKDVPEGASLLCSLTLIQALIMSFSEGTNGYVQASGKIKWFLIISSLLSLSNLPVGYVLFKHGLESYWIIICFIITSLLARINSLYLMHKLLGFNVMHYLKVAYIPPLKVIVIMVAIVVAYQKIFADGDAFHLVGIFFVFIITAFLVFFIGLTGGERTSLISFFNNKLLKYIKLS